MFITPIANKPITCIIGENRKEYARMTPGLKNKGMLDPKRCWKEWTVSLGSLRAVRENLYINGEINPKTGQPPTKSGIQKAAFSWAIENQEEARKDLEYAWEKAGHVLTDELWQDRIVGFAKLIYHQRPGRFQKFLDKHGFQHPA